jgi:hypothetical protein
MAWDKGINFRSTSGFVTDGANETYCLAADSYPTTRGGVTFGWTDAFLSGAADRDAGADRRIAGISFRINSSSQTVVRVDLPNTGSFAVRLALGDTGAQGYQYAQLKDNASVISTIADTDGTAAGNYDDANGTNHTAANWPASNTSLTHTFTSTTFLLTIGSPGAQAGSSTLAHVSFSEASSDPSFRVQVLRPAIFSPGLAR